MIKHITCLPSIEEQYGNCSIKGYKDIVYNVINKIYDMLVNHNLFMAQLCCEYNTYEDIKNVFDDHVSNFLIITYGDFSNEKHMIAYNLLTDESLFYNKWKSELLEYIKNNH